jgi:hypothetical protein
MIREKANSLKQDLGSLAYSPLPAKQYHMPQAMQTEQCASELYLMQAERENTSPSQHELGHTFSV